MACWVTVICLILTADGKRLRFKARHHLIATNGSENLVFDDCRRHSSIHVLQDGVGSFPSKKAGFLVTPEYKASSEQ